jgi:cysteine dioxygenase
MPRPITVLPIPQPGVLILSTHVKPEELTPQPVDCAALTFKAFVELLKSQASPPTLEELNEWLEKAEISAEDLGPYVGFKEGNYWRHRVCRNDAVEMLVLCWRPGHKTPIHDHNGSHGVVRVHAGVLRESIFHYDENKGLSYQNSRTLQIGEVTGAGVPDIHRLENAEDSNQDLITIHVYAPPLGVLKTYKVGSPQIDLYIPDETDV